MNDLEAKIKRSRTSLSLKEMGLEELPSILAEQTQLERLDLSHNRLTRLPEWIGELQNLEFLNLWGNRLRRLPDGIGRLKNLKVLQLESNRLETLPETLAKMESLEELILESNQLSALPDVVLELDSLAELDLGRNPLASLPNGIGRLSSLKRLNLTYTDLESLPESLGELGSLERLVLLGASRLRALPKALSNLNRLRSLCLSNCPALELPFPLSEFKRLKLLVLENCGLKSIPDGLAKLTDMESVKLDNNEIRQIPSSLNDCRWGSLSLCGNPIGLDSFPDNFQSFKLAGMDVHLTPLSTLKLDADFERPESLVFRGLRHKFSKKGFFSELKQVLASWSDSELEQNKEAAIRKVQDSLVGDERFSLDAPSALQTAFLHLFVKRRLSKLKKAAKSALEEHYASNPRTLKVGIQTLQLPERGQPRWSVTFRGGVPGPVVVFELNGWTTVEQTFVG